MSTYFFFAEEAQLTPLLRLGAGACAGIIAMSATYPMDLVRGRLTVQVLLKIILSELLVVEFEDNLLTCYLASLSIKSKFNSFSRILQTEASPRQYRGIFNALSTVFQEEGARALYKGWLPSVIGVVSKQLLILEVHIMQMSPDQFQNNAFTFMFLLLCCVQIPYVGLNFSVYESLKDWLIQTKPLGIAQDSELSVTTRLACGAAAGTIGQTVAYPLDVIRRRMQMVGWKGAASVVSGDGKGNLEYTGMVDAFSKTIKYEGFGALYKGLVPNSVKVS